MTPFDAWLNDERGCWAKAVMVTDGTWTAVAASGDIECNEVGEYTIASIPSDYVTHMNTSIIVNYDEWQSKELWTHPGQLPHEWVDKLYHHWLDNYFSSVCVVLR